MKKQCVGFLLVLIAAVLCAASAMADSGTETINYSDGSIYIGQVVDGLPHGRGTMIWPNGNVYTGDHVNGERTGKGSCSWANGDTYAGSFVNDVRTGKGTYTWADGTVYSGDFVDNQFHGQGTMIWTDGSQYIGGFYDSAFHGPGVYIGADGSVTPCVHENGVWIDETARQPQPSGLQPEDVIGTWVCSGSRTGDRLIPASVTGVEVTMTFRADGTVTHVIGGEERITAWSLDGETLLCGNLPLEMADGELLMNLDGGTLVFVRQ